MSARVTGPRAHRTTACAWRTESAPGSPHESSRAVLGNIIDFVLVLHGKQSAERRNVFVTWNLCFVSSKS